MSQGRTLSRVTLFFSLVAGFPSYDARGESPAVGSTVVVRLVHPDRQANEVLKLFDGGRVPHPAAALAGWKCATRDPNQLGKPLEAVIVMFNPEMASEWKVLHDAELRLDLSAADGKPRWLAIVPGDDGTLSAAITAQRLSGGSDEPPLTDNGRVFGVERLGPAGAMVAAQFGDLLVLGSSRGELSRAIREIGSVARVPETDLERCARQGNSVGNSPGNELDSGLIIDLDAGRMNEGVGTINNRRTVALLKGLGCQGIHGTLGVKGDCLSLEVTTSLDHKHQSKPLSGDSRLVVDQSWLTWVPAERAMGVVSLALEPGAAFLESAFALADRVERADPARAQLAPLRTRLNLLATAARARPEVDLWPHLRGVTAWIMADPDRQGFPGGALMVLHTDGEASALHLATDTLPRLVSLFAGKKNGAEPAKRAAPGEPFELGRIGGRSLLLFCRGRDVAIVWGQEVLRASIEATANPERSVAPLCTGWVRAGKRPPNRVGAVWPSRCWPWASGLDRTTPAWRTLDQAAPAVWWGWTEADRAFDSIRYADLRSRVRDFLARVPLGTPRLQ